MSDITDTEINSIEVNNMIRKTIDAQIIDYYVCSDGDSYDNHIFVIQIRVETFIYTVDRSYIDFVDLDRRLRKRYPKSILLPLPLDAADIIERILSNRERESKRKSIGSGKDNLTQVRESILSTNYDSNHNNYKIRNHLNEEISTKVKNLDNYLVSILTQHELVSSDELLLFLDEEASSMEVDPSTLHPLSEHDLILLSCPVNQVTVRRFEEHIFHVKSGQFILWRFSTLDFDIGFSVEMNNEIKVPVTRYKSHEKIICGTLEAQQNAICKLKWDNSYAKLRTKQLSWVAKVVNPEEYHTAKLQAREVQREKKKFEDQRHALKRSTIFHSSLLSGVILNSSVVSEHENEDKLLIKSLYDEIKQLNESNNKHINEIILLKSDIQSNEQIKHSIEESRDQIMQSWQFTIKQLDQYQNENKLLKHELELLKINYNNLSLANDQLKNELSKSLNDLKEADNREIELTDACKLALDQCDQDILQLKQSYELDKQNLEKQYIELLNENKLELEKSIHLKYQNDIIELNNQLNQLKNTKSGGFFSDTETETELYQRIQQLESEKNILINENKILDAKLSNS